ncbi:MAG: hypothetical protein JWM97_3239 [Phycisphaerales bacterium]|nr:hypothetical protein [Phycisphaerales bacterium]
MNDPSRGHAPCLTILFSGMVAADPWQGGATWAVLQYVLGLSRLGHDVYLIEPVPAGPRRTSLQESDSATYFRQVVRRFALEGRAALLAAGGTETVGLTYDELRAAARRADLLINVSGMLADEALLAPVPRRVYLDLDPAFVQLWYAQGINMRFAAHTHFVTVGQNLGREECPVPTCGIDWIAMAQPVVLSHWPAAPISAIAHQGLTTVANWRGYGSVEYEGTFYGQKAHSWRPLVALPTRTSERFMPALSIHPGEAADLALLAANRWTLLDPARVAATPDEYQRFVRESKAELAVAKAGYVVSRCGWFSDRSACYLASGRPVIAQETGFTRWLPPGEGVFAFSTAEQALSAIEAMNRDYARHARAARALAETYFDSDAVLSRLLRAVGAVQ